MQASSRHLHPKYPTGFQNLAFMIDGAPKVVRHPVDLHVDLVQMPAPMLASAHPVDPSSPDLGGKHRAEPLPPEPHRLVADLDASLVREILHISKRQREPDVEHHRQANDLRAGLEIAKRGAFGRQKNLVDGPAPTQAKFL